MPMQPRYDPAPPSRSAIDALTEPTVLEFGTAWCGHCRALQPVLGAALAERPGVHHLKIEDGSGRPLGRSFGVTLWPTLIFLRDGREAVRLVRPASRVGIDAALAAIEA